MAIKTDLNQKLLEQINDLYTNAEYKMMEKVMNKVKKGNFQPGWNEQKLKDVKDLKKEVGAALVDTHGLAKQKINKGLLSAYLTGVGSANKDHGFPLTAMNEFIPLHLQRLILETNNIIDGTSIQVLRNVQDAYRKIIADTSSGVLIGTDTRKQVAQDALNRFAAKGITGFVDKAGRNWELASYVEMATRTTTAHAALQGHIDRQTDIGNDLVIVSSFGATCPICAPWGGKVLSISGHDQKYDSLDMAKGAGLFHPNCKHTITAYFPELDEDGYHEHEKPYSPAVYNAIQQQRHYERQIRKWKRVESVAMDPVSKQRAAAKVRQWQYVNKGHVFNWDLKRKYQRESIKAREPKNMDPQSGGYLIDKLMTPVDGEEILKKMQKIEQYDLTAKLKKQAQKVPSASQIPTPEPPKVPKTSTLPLEQDLQYVSDGKAAGLGGAGKKSIYESAWDKYIYKPAQTKSGAPAEYKAHVQEGVFKVQNIVDPTTAVPVEVRNLEGSIGTLQPMLEVDKSLDDMLPNFQSYGTKLSDDVIKQIQREHVTDWLSGNFDAHGKNFVFDKSGKLIGLDKEQSFRYINNPKSQVMDYSYHPNATYGETEPVYNTMFRQFAQGKLDFDPNESLKYIERLEKIDNYDYRQMWKPYVESLAPGDSVMQKELLDKIVIRKTDLRKEYETFYGKLLTERFGKPMDFKFGQKVDLKPKPVKPVRKKKLPIGIIDESEYTLLGNISGGTDFKMGVNSPDINIREHSRYVRNDLPQSARDGIMTYTGSAYDPVNVSLRKGVAASSHYDKTIKAIKSAYKNPNMPELGENLKMLRHTGKDVIKHGFSQEAQNIADRIMGAADGSIELTNALGDLKGMITGSTFSDPAFLSTAYKQGIFLKSNGIEFQFFLPKGYKKGLHIEEISHHKSEAEFLIDAGAKFKVIGVDHATVGETQWNTHRNIIIKLIPID